MCLIMFAVVLGMFLAWRLQHPGPDTCQRTLPRARAQQHASHAMSMRLTKGLLTKYDVGRAATQHERGRQDANHLAPVCGREPIADL